MPHPALGKTANPHQSITRPSLAFFSVRTTLAGVAFGTGIRGSGGNAAYVSIVSARPDIRDRLRDRSRRGPRARLGAGEQRAEGPQRHQPHRRHLRGEPQLRQSLRRLGRREWPGGGGRCAHDPGDSEQYVAPARIHLLDAERREPRVSARSALHRLDDRHHLHEPFHQPTVQHRGVHPGGRADVSAAGCLCTERASAERRQPARRLHPRHSPPLLPGAVPAEQWESEPLRDRKRRRRPRDGLLQHDRPADLCIPAQ